VAGQILPDVAPRLPPNNHNVPNFKDKLKGSHFLRDCGDVQLDNGCTWTRLFNGRVHRGDHGWLVAHFGTVAVLQHIVGQGRAEWAVDWTECAMFAARGGQLEVLHFTWEG